MYSYYVYLLNKDREANRARREFKVQPREYIGYLVRYQVSNIYYIQVLAFKRVITIYNVTFDKRTFFNPKREELERLPTKIIQHEVDLLDKGERRQDTTSILDTLLVLDNLIEESITIAINPLESTEIENVLP